MKTHGLVLAAFKHSVWLIGCLSLCAGGVLRADETDGSPVRNSLKPGSWSLQFGITDEWDLESFEGAAISCKRHYSNKSAVRISLGTSASSRDGDSELLDRQRDGESFSESDASSLAFDLTVLYLYYPSPDKRVNFFVGVGPDIGYSWSERNDGAQSCQEQICVDTRRTSTSNSVSLDARAVLGIEWFATENISFLAEYSTHAGYRHATGESETRQREPERSTRSESNEDTFRFGSYDVRVGLSVYF